MANDTELNKEDNFLTLNGFTELKGDELKRFNDRNKNYIKDITDLTQEYVGINNSVSIGMDAFNKENEIEEGFTFKEKSKLLSSTYNDLWPQHKAELYEYVNNKKEFDRKANLFRKEQSFVELQENKGFFKSLGAGVAGEFTDPVNYVPILGQLKVVGTGLYKTAKFANQLENLDKIRKYGNTITGQALAWGTYEAAVQKVKETQRGEAITNEDVLLAGATAGLLGFAFAPGTKKLFQTAKDEGIDDVKYFEEGDEFIDDMVVETRATDKEVQDLYNEGSFTDTKIEAEEIKIEKSPEVDAENFADNLTDEQLSLYQKEYSDLYLKYEDNAFKQNIKIDEFNKQEPFATLKNGSKKYYDETDIENQRTKFAVDKKSKINKLKTNKDLGLNKLNKSKEKELNINEPLIKKYNNTVNNLETKISKQEKDLEVVNTKIDKIHSKRFSSTKIQKETNRLFKEKEKELKSKIKNAKSGGKLELRYKQQLEELNTNGIKNTSPSKTDVALYKQEIKELNKKVKSLTNSINKNKDKVINTPKPELNKVDIDEINNRYDTLIQKNNTDFDSKILKEEENTFEFKTVSGQKSVFDIKPQPRVTASNVKNVKTGSSLNKELEKLNKKYLDVSSKNKIEDTVLTNKTLTSFQTPAGTTSIIPNKLQHGFKIMENLKVGDTYLSRNTKRLLNVFAENDVGIEKGNFGLGKSFQATKRNVFNESLKKNLDTINKYKKEYEETYGKLWKSQMFKDVENNIDNPFVKEFHQNQVNFNNKYLTGTFAKNNKTSKETMDVLNKKPHLKRIWEHKLFTQNMTDESLQDLEDGFASAIESQLKKDNIDKDDAFKLSDEDMLNTSKLAAENLIKLTKTNGKEGSFGGSHIQQKLVWDILNEINSKKFKNVNAVRHAITGILKKESIEDEIDLVSRMPIDMNFKFKVNGVEKSPFDYVVQDIEELMYSEANSVSLMATSNRFGKIELETKDGKVELFDIRNFYKSKDSLRGKLKAGDLDDRYIDDIMNVIEFGFSRYNDQGTLLKTFKAINTFSSASSLLFSAFSTGPEIGIALFSNGITNTFKAIGDASTIKKAIKSGEIDEKQIQFLIDFQNSEKMETMFSQGGRFSENQIDNTKIDAAQEYLNKGLQGVVHPLNLTTQWNRRVIISKLVRNLTDKDYKLDSSRLNEMNMTQQQFDEVKEHMSNFKGEKDIVKLFEELNKTSAGKTVSEYSIHLGEKLTAKNKAGILNRYIEDNFLGKMLSTLQTYIIRVHNSLYHGELKTKGDKMVISMMVTGLIGAVAGHYIKGIIKYANDDEKLEEYFKLKNVMYNSIANVPFIAGGFSLADRGYGFFSNVTNYDPLDVKSDFRTSTPTGQLIQSPGLNYVNRSLIELRQAGELQDDAGVHMLKVVNSTVGNWFKQDNIKQSKKSRINKGYKKITKEELFNQETIDDSFLKEDEKSSTQTNFIKSISEIK